VGFETSRKKVKSDIVEIVIIIQDAWISINSYSLFMFYIYLISKH